MTGKPSRRRAAKVGRSEFDVSRLVKAVAHDVRRRVLRLMADGELHSPKGLSRRLGMPLPNVGYHVRVLYECEVIRLGKTLPARGSVQHFYVISPDVKWVLDLLGHQEGN